MKILIWFLASLAFVHGLVRREDDVDGEVVAGRYLIKLEANAATTETEIKDYIIEHLAGQDSTIKPSQIRFRHVINTALYHGASIEISSSLDEEQIASAIRKIPKSVGTPKPVKGLRHRKEQQDIAKPVKSVAPQFSAQAWHIKSTVDQLHKRGIYGKGVKVGVIDSGIYYKHPALGGGFGPGFKVAYGQNFADDPSTDDDNIPEDCQGHGTHVAGIIAGNATGITDPAWKPAIDWWGVAPQATLGAYKIAGCPWMATEDSIVAAIYQSQKDGMQVINLSLGNHDPYLGNLIWEAVEAVEKAGVIVVVAAGNNGHAGAYTVSNPASSAKALAVGAIVSLKIWEYVVEGPKGSKFTYRGDSTGTGWDGIWNKDVNIVRGEFASPPNNTVCPSLLNPQNATGKAVLYVAPETPPEQCNRRFCMPCDLCQSIQAAGGIACIEAADRDDNVAMATTVPIPSGTVTTQNAQGIFAALARNGTVPWRFTNEVLTLADFQTSGGRPLEMTSLGLTQDLQIKPDLAGFGGQVYSTYPPSLSQTAIPYAFLSGTSMAAPYVVGVIALYLEAHQSENPTPEAIRNIFRRTANPVRVEVLKGKTTKSVFASVAQQGGGLVNAVAAVLGTTVVSPSALPLNDTVRFGSGERTVRIRNHGTKRVTYRLKHVPAALLETSSNNNATDKYIPFADENLRAVYASVKFSATTISILPGREASVNVKFTVPKRAGLPIYSGYLQISSQDKVQTVRVPYAGVIGDISTRPILSRQPQINSVYDYMGPLGVEVSGSMFYINMAIATASRLVKTELIPANATTPVGTVKTTYRMPAAGLSTLAAVSRNVNRHMTGNNTAMASMFAGVPLPWGGEVYTPAFAIREIVRDNFTQVVAARNFTMVPAGRYFVRFSGLKVFGNLWNERDYDVWDTNVFEVKARSSTV
ncbi:hypothetical protein HK097_003676 [Rhizophlyctis rosea]|uniref:Peptidase S8/S53 domain-containing protein n=1 Tax=Rhizophlyctis rosea TaxID=64517 RepID=A0AAD5X7D6_9FUNG|nr:hypothetical protein HK097_003676 [Rhizophlyctis rosea]